MDFRRSPEGISTGHPSDEIPDLSWNFRTAFASPPAFPTPEELEAFAMPADNGLWLHDDEGLGPVSPDPRQKDPEQAIGF